jgi:hypothetical protein
MTNLFNQIGKLDNTHEAILARASVRMGVKRTSFLKPAPIYEDLIIDKTNFVCPVNPTPFL